MPMTSALLASVICGTAHAGALALKGEDFPELLAHTPLAEQEKLPPDAKPTPQQAAVACAHVRAKRPSELEGAWARVVEAIEFTCEYAPNELGDGLATTAKARLRPGAARFLGVDVVEVRLRSSDWGWDQQYVLAGALARDGEPLIEKIRSARCRGTAMSCDIEKGASWMHDGFYIRTMEGGGVWLHPDEDNPQQMIYAEAWSE